LISIAQGYISRLTYIYNIVFISESIVAQKDYISRSKKSGQQKKTAGKRKQSTTKSSYKIWLLLIVVGTFIAGLYFLKTSKPTKPDVITPQQTTPNNTNAKGSNVPPLPEKRWGYPDELTNPGANRNTPNAGINTEQQRILAEMAVDRPQNTTTSSTYNEQVGRNSQSPINQSLVAMPSRPATNTANTGSTTAAKPATTTQSNTAATRWTLQCGAFRNQNGAESIKAQLALSGIASQIIFSNNLHRVVIGPFSNQSAANSMQTRAQNAGVTGCSVRG